MSVRYEWQERRGGRRYRRIVERDEPVKASGKVAVAPKNNDDNIIPTALSRIPNTKEIDLQSFDPRLTIFAKMYPTR